MIKDYEEIRCEKGQLGVEIHNAKANAIISNQSFIH